MGLYRPPGDEFFRHHPGKKYQYCNYHVKYCENRKSILRIPHTVDNTFLDIPTDAAKTISGWPWCVTTGGGIVDVSPLVALAPAPSRRATSPIGPGVEPVSLAAAPGGNPRAGPTGGGRPGAEHRPTIASVIGRRSRPTDGTGIGSRHERGVTWLVRLADSHVPPDSDIPVRGGHP